MSLASSQVEPGIRATPRCAPGSALAARGACDRSSTGDPPTSGDRRERALAVQWTLLAVLLVAEGTLISARFDAAPIGEALPQWWAQGLSRIGVLVPLSIALGTAVLLFAGTRLRTELRTAAAHPRRDSRRWLLLAAHAVAFAAFFSLTAIVFEGALRTARLPIVWVAVWLVAGAAALASWFAALLPGVTASSLLRRLGPTLPTSVAVGLAAWSAGDLSATWWDPLRHSTLWAVHRLLVPVLPRLDVQAGSYVIGTDTFLVQITPKCAGYEGMGLTAVFLGAYLWLFRRRLRFPHALLLLPIGLCLAWWANVLRIAALLAIGAWGWEALAVGGFHAYSGSILFCALALGLAFVAERLPFFSADEASAPIHSTPDATAAYLAPLLAMVATRMLTGMVTTSDASLSGPLQTVVGLSMLWWCRHTYRDLNWSWSWAAAGTGLAAGVLWMVLAPAAPATSAAWPADAATGWVGTWIVFQLVATIVLIPVAEELAFRGYLMRRLIHADFEAVSSGQFTWRSFLGSSLLFGLMHEHLLAGTLAGMCYAAAVYRRGRLADAVLAHAAANALVAVYVLGAGRWALWS